MALYPEQYDAGYGEIYFTPPGGLTPVQVGEAQDLSFTFPRDLKPMYGREYLPRKAILGQAKPTGKVKFTRLYPEMEAAIFQNSTLTTGNLVPQEEIVTGIGATYTVLNAGASAVDYDSNLSVFDVTDPTKRIPLAAVASNPAAGQFAVDEVTPGQGVYTFAAADSGKTYKVCYLKKTTYGRTLSVNSGPLAMAPQFSLKVFNVFDGQVNGFWFYCAWIPGLNFGFAKDDTNATELDITLGQDSAGRFIKRVYGAIAP